MEEMNYNMQMKLDLQFQSGEAFIYLFDKAQADVMISRESAELIYLPVDEWADIIPADELLYKKDGTAYAVSLAGNRKIKDIGIHADDIYLAVMMNNFNADEALYENSKHLASALISD